MWCQSRNRRPSATSCVQCPTSYSFHQPHPATHRTASYSENPSRLGLRKSFLNGFHDSPPKVFLCLSRQRASILFSHARTLPHCFVNVTYIMLRLVAPMAATQTVPQHLKHCNFATITPRNGVV